MAEINVTPFVDVMMVLLIIFMVAAPLMTVGVEVNLPETAAGALDAEEEEEPLTVTVTADGRLMIQTTEAERTSNKVFLRADGASTYERVAQVMGALNAGGFSDIGLVNDFGGPTLDGLQ